MHNLWKIWRPAPRGTGSNVWQADEIWARSEILKVCYRSKYSILRFLNKSTALLKGQLKWKIDLCLINRLVTAKQIGIDSSGLSHLVELLQTIKKLQEMPSLNVTPRMRARVLRYNVL